MAQRAEEKVVFVTAGTDVHPFERLAVWTEQLAERSDPPLRVVFQHGTSRPARGAENHEMLGSDEFAALLDTADLVVAQGGPGGITEARAHGRLPLVVPRSGSLGEHVDDHQQIFAAMMADRGLVRVATDVATFAATVTEMLANGSGRIPPDKGPGAEFEQQFRTVVAAARPLSGRDRLRRIWSSARPVPPA